MASFYKLDARTRILQVLDSTGGDPWDSTSYPGEDSTSTQNETFRITGARWYIPFVDLMDSTAVEDVANYHQLGAIFQCPAGYSAIFEEATLTYMVPDDSTNIFTYGDTTTGFMGIAKFRFFVTGMPLDTTATVWAPTNWIVEQAYIPGQQPMQSYSIRSPLNRPMLPGESVDLRVMPHDGPFNYASVVFSGYLEAQG